MFGLISKKRHDLEMQLQKNEVSSLKARLSKAVQDTGTYAGRNVELTKQLNEANGRLAKAVEGLTKEQICIIENIKCGFYTYEVGREVGGAMKYTKVYVPTSAKYPDYMAKRLAGYKKTDKGAKARRLTI